MVLSPRKVRLTKGQSKVLLAPMRRRDIVHLTQKNGRCAFMGTIIILLVIVVLLLFLLVVMETVALTAILLSSKDKTEE